MRPLQVCLPPALHSWQPEADPAGLYQYSLWAGGSESGKNCSTKNKVRIRPARSARPALDSPKAFYSRGPRLSSYPLVVALGSGRSWRRRTQSVQLRRILVGQQSWDESQRDKDENHVFDITWPSDVFTTLSYVSQQCVSKLSCTVTFHSDVTVRLYTHRCHPPRHVTWHLHSQWQTTGPERLEVGEETLQVWPCMRLAAHDYKHGDNWRSPDCNKKEVLKAHIRLSAVFNNVAL